MLSYATSIDSLLAASPTGNYKSIFSTFVSPPTAASCVYNANLWGGGGAAIDFSGIIWYDDGNIGYDAIANGVAITKRHVLCTNHGGHSVGGNATWIKRDGSVVVRNLVDGVIGIDGTDPLGWNVLYLDADLPAGIAIYPVLDDTLTSFSGLPAIKLDNENKAGIVDAASKSSFQQPTDPTRLLYYEDSISGDSGSPAFFLVGSQLIYATSIVFGGGGTGMDLAASLLNIVAACALLDSQHARTGYLPVLFPTFAAGSGQYRAPASLDLGCTL